MRVLQVVQSLNPGGIESWLVAILRNMDRGRHQFDFFVGSPGADIFDSQVGQMGARIFRCVGGANQPWKLHSLLSAVLKNEGPYDAIHCHGTRAMGFHMRVAARAGVPVRIVHSHSTQHSSKRESRRRWRSYVSGFIAGRWMLKHMTVGLACSEEAGASLFGDRWGVDRRLGVCFCGVDFARLAGARPKGQVRAELGIPGDARVVLHVGNFRYPKNQAKIVEMAGVLLGRRKDVFVVLVGQGPDSEPVKREVARLGLAGRVIFTGPRTDVPDLLAAADTFVLPSFREGMPLALLEAQAAGLPCVASDTIVSSSHVIPELIRSLPPDAPGARWAEAVEQAVTEGRRNPEACLDRLNRSEFSIQRSLDALLAVYSTNAAPAGAGANQAGPAARPPQAQAQRS
jgi:glycosyltransferase involved in cell wall biosynthesis